MTSPETYDPHAIEERWLARWDGATLRREGGDKRYVLTMFSYPSGDLHMGHAEVYAIADAWARFAYMTGHDVLFPVGFDSFGLPAENAAIKRGADPVAWTYANIETQSASFRRYGVAADWSTYLATSDPDYYRWTQWLFLRLYENGLAYRRESQVNWCPHDQTVLANEQVVQGRCERCGTLVTKRTLTQWYFKITAYAQRLLDDMSLLQWPESVLAMQRNWIGRSEGAYVDFAIGDRTVTVFTTRPDTLAGATFFVVAADAPLAAELCAPEQRAAFEAYREQVAALTEVERQSTDREKTGVPLGVTATNPLTGAQIPVWAADYVLAEYGTGAIMAVPAHDQRDLDFARAFDLPVTVVVDTGEPDPASSGTAATGDGPNIVAGPLQGLGKADAIRVAIETVESAGTGRGTTIYRLRDWLLSRQRYWGAPIPIVHCPDCGEVPVPDDQLPVVLPATSEVDLTPKGISPLATAEGWLHVDCPSCGGPATRDTDTMDTFVDSSWYFLRYCSPGLDTAPFAREDVDTWLPARPYIGGKEHAILHLLYARFFTKALYDLDLVGTPEPFAQLVNQGEVINEGRGMSKSLGNGVDLGGELERYGVDAVRVTMLFASPPEDDVDWADVSPAGAGKWLKRVWQLAGDVGATAARDAAAAVTRGHRGPTERAVAKLVAETTEHMAAHRFNVAIARCMELTNLLRKEQDAGYDAGPGTTALVVMVAPFAPYTADESWERLGRSGSATRQDWPVADPALLVDDTTTCVVQVNGKVRARLEVPRDIAEEALRSQALEAVASWIEGREIRTVVVRAPKLVNVVLV